MSSTCSSRKGKNAFQSSAPQSRQAKYGNRTLFNARYTNPKTHERLSIPDTKSSLLTVKTNIVSATKVNSRSSHSPHSLGSARGSYPSPRSTSTTTISPPRLYATTAPRPRSSPSPGSSSTAGSSPPSPTSPGNTTHCTWCTVWSPRLPDCVSQAASP